MSIPSLRPLDRAPGAVRTELYRSDNLLVVGVQPFGSRSVAITFCPWAPQPTLEQPGFGEGFLIKYGIDAIHVICRDNCWYQYDDTCAALDAAVAHAAPYANKVAMGWSMGGYAAINFSQYIGVDRVIAVSPQFSGDPAKVPFETRWSRDRRAIRFRHDRIDTLARDGRQIWLLFDDRHPIDRRHVELIRARLNVIELALPHSGHPAGAILASLGMLANTVTRMIEGNLDREEFAAELHELQASRKDARWSLLRRGASRLFRSAADR